MTTSLLPARLIYRFSEREVTVLLYSEGDAWWVESDDLPGWSACGSTSELLGYLGRSVRWGLQEIGEGAVRAVREYADDLRRLAE